MRRLVEPGKILFKQRPVESEHMPRFGKRGIRRRDLGEAQVVERGIAAPEPEH